MVLATLGPRGRMISGSKTGYRDRHPDHLPVFNANVCFGSSKVWHGDLDLTPGRGHAAGAGRGYRSDHQCARREQLLTVR